MGSTTEQLVTQAMHYPDYLIIGVAFLIFAAYGFVRGTKALSELALAVPLGAFVFTLFPYSLGWGEPAVYGLLVVASLWVITRDTSGLDDNTDLVKVSAAAFGATALLLVVVLNKVDFTSLYTFGTQVTTFLADSTYTFYVAAAALIAVALSRKI